MTPRISVVIPAHNEERFLANCLRSLKQQDFSGSYEVIVVDNASSDKTALIAGRHGATIIHEPQLGVCSARQAGTEKARGDIIVSTDADTVFPKNWLSQISNDFASHPDVVAVTGTFQFAAAPWWGRLYSKALFGIVQAIYSRTGSVQYLTASNSAFRKSAWTGYDVALTQGGDEFHLLQQLKGQGKIIFRRDSVVSTSSRRLYKGFLYTVFVTILSYYIFEYLIGRMFGRRVLGSFPVIRHEAPPQKKLALTRSIAAVIVIVFVISMVTNDAFASRVTSETKHRLGSLRGTIAHRAHHRFN